MNFIITLDYELFGDGSGNVFTHMIDPTKKILGILDDNNIKSTIFFEIVEYLKLKEEWDNGNTMGYTSNPIWAIENQIQSAAKNGHDIQLHIHPQWLNAKYINNKWKVDNNNWRLGDFHGVDGLKIKDLLKLGKVALENLIKPVVPDYECIGLRAGGYNIMPSKEIYLAMREIGLKYDSSIFPGGYENSTLSKYDYRKVSLFFDYWWADELDMRVESIVKKEIVEIPIFSLPIARWKKVLNFSKIKSFFLTEHSAVSSVSKEKLNQNNLNGKIKFLIEKQVYTWDFCMFSPALHKKLVNYITSLPSGKRNTFVLIGHPKNFQSKKNLERFLKIIRNKRYFSSFKTLNEIYANIS